MPHSLQRPLAAVAILFFVGALVGTAGDQIHVQFHVLDYAHPYLLGQAFWVPLLFGCAGLVMVHSHRIVRPRSPTDGPRATTLIVPFLLFAAAYFATGIFKDSPRALTAALSLAWLLRVAIAPSVEKVFSGIAFAVCGSLFEAALSSTGAFRYLVPNGIGGNGESGALGGIGVPVWLPALYLHVSLLTRSIYLYGLHAIAAPSRTEQANASLARRLG